METKNLYRKGVWEKILTHPGYTLGSREKEALKRIMLRVKTDGHFSKKANVLHLGSGIGYEIPFLINALPEIDTYLLNNIVPEDLACALDWAERKFPNHRFIAQVADIEMPSTVTKLRNSLSSDPTLITLIANATIFSNRNMDAYLHEAMQPNDAFLLTVEMPHDDMFESYLIEPVLTDLLRIPRKHVRIWYDKTAHCLKMECDGEPLLSSYKPTASQLRKRMSDSGFAKVALEEYHKFHMIGSLWRRA